MRRAEAGETKIVPDTDRGDSSEDQSDRNLAVLEQVTKELLPLAKDRGQVGQVAERIVAVFESYQGPLPHPRHFREFEIASPGSAKIILEMAQAEQMHRHRMQRARPPIRIVDWRAVCCWRLDASSALPFLAGTTSRWWLSH